MTAETPVSRRVLVVCPAFQGYGQCIADALVRRGHDVTTHVYDALTSVRDKVRNKLVYELPDRLGGTRGFSRQRAHATSRAIEVLRATRPARVLVVKGDLLTRDFWDAVLASGAHGTRWLYDEIARTHFDSPDELALPHQLVSYSPGDVATLERQGLPVVWIPDAFDAHARFRRVPSDEVVFVGARYPERGRVLAMLHARGVPVRAYGRTWSRHPLDRARTWEVRRPDVPASRDVPRSVGYGVVAGAVAGLNSHTDQDGFTMRTYEIPGAGGLQLIDRPDVQTLYEPEKEVLVYTSDDHLVELAERALADRSWSAAIRAAGRRRTLAEHTFDHRVRALEGAWA
jgi:spore maturation protein CgeB